MCAYSGGTQLLISSKKHFMSPSLSGGMPFRYFLLRRIFPCGSRLLDHMVVDSKLRFSGMARAFIVRFGFNHLQVSRGKSVCDSKDWAGACKLHFVGHIRAPPVLALLGSFSVSHFPHVGGLQGGWGSCHFCPFFHHINVRGCALGRGIAGWGGSGEWESFCAWRPKLGMTIY